MSEKSDGWPIEILLVEDNPGDVRLTVEALRDGKVQNRLSTVGDGEAALAFLRREGAYADAPRPDLILLDLNLPGVNGREVLAQLRADPRLQSIPVVVLTASRADQDVVEAYRLQVNAYVTKPVDLEQFVGIVRAIDRFWLTIVALPDGRDEQ